MAELMDRGIQRLASAADMPVSILMELAGGTANTDDIDRWDGQAEAWRNEVLFPNRHERIAKLIMLARRGPFHGELPEHWDIVYGPLRATPPKLAADVRLVNAQAPQIAIDKGIAPPEAFAIACYTATGGMGDPRLDPDEAEAKLAGRREL